VRKPRLPKLAAVRVRAAAAAALAAALCLGGGALWLRHVIYANSVAASIVTAQSRALAIASTYETPAARVNADLGTLAIRSSDFDDPESNPGRIADTYRKYKTDQFPYFGADAVNYVVVDNHGKVLEAQDQLAYYIREGGLTLPTSPPQSREFGFPRVRVLLRPASSGQPAQLDGRTVTLVAYNTYNAGTSGLDAKDAKATVYVLASPLDAEAVVAPVDHWLRRGLPPAVLFVAAVAWWAAGRALRPVDRMRAELARITATDMSSRVPQPRTGDEIARLAETMNATLDRLHRAQSRSQRHWHQLRTRRPRTYPAPAARLPADLVHVGSHPARARPALHGRRARPARRRAERCSRTRRRLHEEGHGRRHLQAHGQTRPQPRHQDRRPRHRHHGRLSLRRRPPR
jgi:HAMP domain-containing protein